jgi:prophage tail gpP-like protein
MTVINQRFGESIAWTGKTVFHCHFLDHEDQGMIAAMIIADPRGEEPPTQPTKKSAKKSKGKKMKNSKQSK